MSDGRVHFLLQYQHSNTVRIKYGITWLYIHCGDACSPHLSKVSCHYGVVVKCFASGQCGPVDPRPELTRP